MAFRPYAFILDDIKCLSDTTPFVYKLLKDGCLDTPWVRDMVEECVTVAGNLALAMPHQQTADDFVLADDDNSFIPNIAVVRSRGRYQADKRHQSDKICTKNAYHHKALLPGVFTIHCQHGEIAI